MSTDFSIKSTPLNTSQFTGNDAPLIQSDKAETNEVAQEQVTRGPTSSTVTAAISNYKELKSIEMQGIKVSISDEHIIRELEKALKAAEGKNTFLEFSVHEATNRIMIKVMDKESGDIIREIPPEKSLEFLEKVKIMSGILFDERR